MKHNDLKAQVAIAVKACQEKKAEDLTILRLDVASGLTDYFVLCTGSNPRQVAAIADGVDEFLSKVGVEPSHVDGRRSENWVALDYGDFMVHVFSESARKFYDLERLWKTASRLQPTDLEKPADSDTARKKTAVGAKRAGIGKSVKKSPAKKSARKPVRKGK
jgi:ribosome-associated protein